MHRRLIVLALFPLSAVAAENSLLNPGFDSDISGWDNPWMRPAQWSDVDSSGQVGIGFGSALITNDTNPSGGSTPLVLAQCFAASPGQPVRFGGESYIPPGSVEFSLTSIVLYQYDMPNCEGVVVQFDSIFGGDIGVWSHGELDTVVHTDAASIFLAFGVAKPAGETAPVDAHFDDLTLDLSRVFSDGFE